MSQKNETKVLVISLLLTIGILGGGIWFFVNKAGVKFDNANTPNQTNNNQPINERISFGEKSLTIGNIFPAKKDGIQAIANKNYEKAIADFTASLKNNRNDPEALIYQNNARIGNGKNYTIVTSLPIGNNPNAALEILRGMAQSQSEINTAGGIKGIPLKIGIANDEDNPEISKQIAATLVKNSDNSGRGKSVNVSH
ncbi:ABC transporter substrate-binding protein [Anabaena sp. PCC 7938]|uniref:ABC transporter substrate-binding protein n=1 Tax=Anabaena TaxID=1163 RepID=UPI0002DEA98E|nr:MULTISPECIES: ABC transporter substrate-binding protein [Anabaena]BAY04809.1 extracellular ligand-binding receptor [Anabaena cylindrica PCC 7122]